MEAACVWFALAAALGGPQPGPGVPAGPPAQAAPIEREIVPLEDLLRRPLRYLGEVQRIVVQLDAPQESWSPYLTRYDPERYAAFVVWSDEQRPWNQADYAAPMGRLFARRGEVPELLLSAAVRHRRFELEVLPRDYHHGGPWIEVLAARPLLESIDEGTLVHAARALELLAKRDYRLAAEDLQRALAAPLPEAARLDLESLLEHCRAQLAGRSPAQR